MNQGPDRPDPRPGCYQLPKEAYQALEQARDRLRLLAGLAQARPPHDGLPEAELLLKPAALAQSFQELADRLDDSLERVRWPEPPPA